MRKAATIELPALMVLLLVVHVFVLSLSWSGVPEAWR
jgi:hypothetical protein